MTDRNIFEAIITLPSDNSVMLLEGLSILHKYSNKTQLYATAQGDVYYSVPINDLLEKDITEEDITKLKNSSWYIKDNNLIKEM